MAKSKTIILILAVLVLLFAAVSFSGCLGGEEQPEGNVTTPPEGNETVPPAGNETVPPAGNETAPPVTPFAGSATVTLGEQGPTPVAIIQTSNQRFPRNTLEINAGETVRFRNAEQRPFRHLIASDDGAFESFTIDPRYSALVTFNEPGTYRILLLNHHTGAPFGDGTAPVLTITVR